MLQRPVDAVRARKTCSVRWDHRDGGQEGRAGRRAGYPTSALVEAVKRIDVIDPRRLPAAASGEHFTIGRTGFEVEITVRAA